jgi:type IV fimbrial biogenesis protein FimT
MADKNHGFTLLQLLVALAIMSILTTQALPAMRDISASSKATATINQIFQYLQYARSLALSQSRHITVCGYDEGNQCASDWEDGIKIFHDANVDGAQDPGEATMRVFRFPSGESHVDLNASFGVSYIRFTPLGTTYNGNGNIVYCAQAGDTRFAKVLIYYRSGRIYVGQDENDNGVPENGSGQDVSC